MTEPTTPVTPPPVQTPQPTQEPEIIPLPPAPALPFTFKASLAEYRKALGVARVVIALAISTIIWFRFGFLAWIIFVVVIALILGVLILLLTRRSVTVNADGIEYKNGFGIVKNARFDEIESVKIFAQYVDLSFGLMPRIIVGKKGSGAIVSLIGIFWQPDDLNKLLAIVKDKNLPSEFYPDPVNSASIAKQFPTYLPYYERHPFVVAFGIVVAIVIAVTVFVLLTM